VKIGLVLIGKGTNNILEKLKDGLKDVFQSVEFEIREGLPHPDYAHNNSRNQYYSSLILEEIKKHKPEDTQKLLGVTDVDLYVPSLNFVFGEADSINGVALISLCRLKQDFYGKFPDEEIFQERMVKEAVHEVGHTFGLGHCRDNKCVMFFSNSITDTDNKGKSFCEKCKRIYFRFM
jgi:archaemetzincin